MFWNGVNEEGPLKIGCIVGEVDGEGEGNTGEEGIGIGEVGGGSGGVGGGGGGRGISKISTILSTEFKVPPPPNKMKFFNDVAARKPRP